jgi:hypothetical protein
MDADASSGETRNRDEMTLDHWIAHLATLSVHEISLSLDPRRPGPLPEPLLVVVRGLLGEALRARRCLTGAPRCEGCSDAPQCDFDRVFERDDGAGQRPFWLRGLHAGRALEGDQTLQVTLSVVDRERALLPDFLAALRHALGAIGDRDAPLNVLGIPSRAVTTLVPTASTEASVSAICIESLTPLLLRGDETLAAELCPGAPIVGLLLRAGIRRLAAMRRAAAPDVVVPKVLWPPLTGLHVRDDALRPWRATRNAIAQQRRQLLEGFVGEVTVVGEGLDVILPLLRVLERTNVGRKTAFGFGEVRVTAWS